MQKTKEKILFSGLIDNDVDLLSLVEDETLPDDSEFIEKIHLVPLRNSVFFPNVVTPIFMGREASIKVIKKKYKEDKFIGVVTQKDATVENPKEKDIYKYGTLAKIIKIIEMPDGTQSAIIQGLKAFKIREVETEKSFLVAKIDLIEEKRPKKNDKEFEAVLSNIKDSANSLIEIHPGIGDEAIFSIKNIEEPLTLINFICSNVDFSVQKKQKLLRISDVKKRALELLSELADEIQKMQLRGDISYKVQKNLNKNQKEFILQQKIK
ncbi:MAG: LON peptidase substrate-binding domain-containing protein [Bacteroidota bacterium]|nr:LON peptidase substrate-binding domain-containing protein [Bacteroidota bacterium]